MLRFICGCLVTTLLSVSATTAATEQDVLNDAVDLCLAMPETTDRVTSNLTANGWSEEDDQTTALLLMSAIFTFQLDLDDLPNTFTNASFMAVSVLGNSSLGPNQPSFSRGDIVLAAIGVDEDAPYCVLGGPIESIGSVWARSSRTALTLKKDKQMVSLGHDQGGMFMSAIVDRQVLLGYTNQFDADEQKRNYREFIETALPQAIVSIYPSKVLEQVK